MSVVGCRDAPRRAEPARAPAPAVVPATTTEAETEPAGFVLRGLTEEPRAIALCSRGAEAMLVADVGAERHVVFVGAQGGPSGGGHEPSSSSRSLRFCTAHRGSYLVASIEARDPLHDLLVLERYASGDAHPTGSLELPSEGRITGVRRSASDEAALVAYTGAEGPVRIALVEVAQDRPMLRSLASGDAPDGLSREVLGADLGVDGPLVLFRRGAPEDARGGVVMVTERGAHELEALADMGLLEQLVRSGEQAIVLASFEFDRPHAFRFALDGTPLESTRLAGSERPAFVPVRPRADVDADAHGIELRIRDAAGDVLRNIRIPRSAGRTPPALARDGHDFLVATTDSARDGWGVRVVRSSPEGRPR